MLGPSTFDDDNIVFGSCCCSSRPKNIQANTPYGLTRLFGRMSLGIAGQSPFSSPSCSNHECASRDGHDGSASVEYYFPNWLLRRGIKILGMWSSPSLCFSMTVEFPKALRFADWDALFPVLAGGDKQALVKVMSMWRIGLSDVGPCGRSTYMVCLQWNRGDLCAMFLKNGYDIDKQDRSLRQEAWRRWLSSSDRVNSPLHTLISCPEFRREGKKNLGLTRLHLMVLGLSPVREFDPALINVQDCFGYTPLHWAAITNDGATVQSLIDRGANLNARCVSGGTPLWWAARNSGNESLPILLEAGADVSLLGPDGTNALWAACYYADNARELVPLLLKHGSDADNRCESELASCFAVTTDPNVYDALMDYVTDWEAADRQGFTAIFRAVMGNHAPAVRYLCNKGAQLNRMAKMGGTLITYAATYAGIEVMEILTEARISGIPMKDANIKKYYSYFIAFRDNSFVGTRAHFEAEESAFSALLSSVWWSGLGESEREAHLATCDTTSAPPKQGN